MHQGFDDTRITYAIDPGTMFSLDFSMMDGSSFLVPLQIGKTFGEESVADMGLGLQIGSTRFTMDGQEFSTSTVSPNIFGEYYIVNRWFPLQFGFGFTIGYSNARFEWSGELPDINDVPVRYDTRTSWGGLNYGISLLGRYWLGKDENNAVQLAVGNRADMRKLRSLEVNGAAIPFDRSLSVNDLYTEGLFFQLSYVRYFGE